MSYQSTIACPHCGGDLQPDGPVHYWCSGCVKSIPFEQVIIFMDLVDDDA